MSVGIWLLLSATQLVIVASMWLFARTGSNSLAAYVVAAACLVGCVVANALLLRLRVHRDEENLARARAQALDEQMQSVQERQLQLERLSGVARIQRRQLAAELVAVARSLEATGPDGEAEHGAEAAGPTHPAVTPQRLRAAAALVGVPEQLCEHRIVDAVVREKREAMRAQGIACELRLTVPAALEVSDVDLCSVFSNIMDNALAACAAMSSAPGRFFRLDARVAGGYLMIGARNSCASDARIVPPMSRASLLDEHGWGLQILRLLADRYDGICEFECAGDTFVVRLSLRAH